MNYKFLRMRKRVQIRMRDILDWNGNVSYAPSKISEPEQKKVSYRVRVSI